MKKTMSTLLDQFFTKNNFNAYKIAVADLLFSGTYTNPNNQSKSNNYQNINKTSGVEKFNQGTFHNNSSSNLIDSYDSTNESRNVKFAVAYL